MGFKMTRPFELPCTTPRVVFHRRARLGDQLHYINLLHLGSINIDMKNHYQELVILGCALIKVTPSVNNHMTKSGVQRMKDDCHQKHFLGVCSCTWYAICMTVVRNTCLYFSLPRQRTESSTPGSLRRC